MGQNERKLARPSRQAAPAMMATTAGRRPTSAAESQRFSQLPATSIAKARMTKKAGSTTATTATNAPRLPTSRKPASTAKLTMMTPMPDWAMANNSAVSGAESQRRRLTSSASKTGRAAMPPPNAPAPIRRKLQNKLRQVGRTGYSAAGVSSEESSSSSVSSKSYQSLVSPPK